MFMFRIIKWIASRFAKSVKIVLGLLVGAVLICGAAQLFAVGGAAGLVVNVSCWVVERGVPAIVAGVSAMIASAGVLGTAVGILVGLLLLGVAKVATDAAGAIIGPIVAGYRAGRLARPADAA